MATQLIDNQYFTNNLKVYSNICKAPSACINNLHLVPAAFTVEKIIGYFDNPLVDPNAYVNCNSQSSQTKTGTIGKDEKLPSLQSSCNLLCNKDFEDDKLVQNGAFGFFTKTLYPVGAPLLQINKLKFGEADLVEYLLILEINL
ncbi:MAG: hypothetical protein IPG12_00980 [Saprospiraceae bacterium]|nr:hypothetical protein [Saprospiraceae bacterium]